MEQCANKSPRARGHAGSLYSLALAAFYPFQPGRILPTKTELLRNVYDATLSGC